ncbi:uncharacterized protein METZ01_LOCUS147075, partial [marine metagenome]
VTVIASLSDLFVVKRSANLAFEYPWRVTTVCQKIARPHSHNCT